MFQAKTLIAFDAYMASNGLELDAVIVGGAALILQGIVTRLTRDCDILSPILDQRILDAAERFAQQDGFLQKDWFNNGPSSLVDDLPEGWMERTVVRRQRHTFSKSWPL